MPGDYDIEYCSPWAGANYFPYVYSVPLERDEYTDLFPDDRSGKPGSSHAEWEKATFPVLKELTEKHPEAGIHFQGMLVLCSYELLLVTNC